MGNYRDLKVWQRSHQLTLRVYQAVKALPNFEMYGLASQLRRSAASIGYNIVEGNARLSRIEFARFLNIAYSSACELDYQLLLARDLGYLESEFQLECEQELDQIRRILNTLIERNKA